MQHLPDRMHTVDACWIYWKCEIWNMIYSNVISLWWLMSSRSTLAGGYFLIFERRGQELSAKGMRIEGGWWLLRVTDPLFEWYWWTFWDNTDRLFERKGDTSTFWEAQMSPVFRQVPHQISFSLIINFSRLSLDKTTCWLNYSTEQR
jgi:hypothetical protein